METNFEIKWQETVINTNNHSTEIKQDNIRIGYLAVKEYTKYVNTKTRGWGKKEEITSTPFFYTIKDAVKRIEQLIDNYGYKKEYCKTDDGCTFIEYSNFTGCMFKVTKKFEIVHLYKEQDAVVFWDDRLGGSKSITISPDADVNEFFQKVEDICLLFQ